MTRPHVLIKDWLPIGALGAESKRERGASSALPPLYFLHVWWARRPLTGDGGRRRRDDPTHARGPVTGDRGRTRRGGRIGS
jgi:hypothetical protein